MTDSNNDYEYANGLTVRQNMVWELVRKGLYEPYEAFEVVDYILKDDKVKPNVKHLQVTSINENTVFILKDKVTNFGENPSTGGVAIYTTDGRYTEIKEPLEYVYREMLRGDNENNSGV